MKITSKTPYLVVERKPRGRLIPHPFETRKEALDFFGECMDKHNAAMLHTGPEAFAESKSGYTVAILENRKLK